VKGGEKTPTQLGPLERANLNHWTETDPVSETSCFLVSRIPDDGKVQKNPIILCVIHRRQNPSESTVKSLSCIREMSGLNLVRDNN
jgi:hypothetical protein